MSEIKTDKLTGTSTAGSILVTGEGNSTTTNLQQGLAKSFAFITDINTIVNSFNTSSISDDATGNFTITISNGMSSINEAVLGTACNSAANPSNSTITGKMESTTTIAAEACANNGASVDIPFCSIAVLGDLA
tara:strand:+ start:372 stop:770 length:399 start_codon:yes stop_codon:yes gene_type:complete